MRRLVILVASFSILAGVSFGQSRGGASASAGVRAAAPMGVSHVGTVAGGARVSSAAGVVHVPAGTHLVVKNWQIHVRSNAIGVKTTTPRTNRPRPLLSQDQQYADDNGYPVPGLGFDMTHYAAVHPGSTNGRPRRPQQFAAFFPFYDGGFLAAPQTIVEDEPTADTQQVDNTAQTDAPEPRVHMRYREQVDVTPSVDSAAAPRESEQYVFVRRDGTIIFAVAYTWDNGSLRYVTTEGFKRSVSMDSLDLDATRQFNEQRGLSFRLPV